MSAVIGKQVLAFGKGLKSEFINIEIFAASSGGRKGRRQIGRDHMYGSLPPEFYNLQYSCSLSLNRLKLINILDVIRVPNNVYITLFRVLFGCGFGNNSSIVQNGSS